MNGKQNNSFTNATIETSEENGKGGSYAGQRHEPAVRLCDGSFVLGVIALERIAQGFSAEC